MRSSRNSARESHSVAEKVGAFLAHCTVIRGCRNYPQLRGPSPVALVLVTPEGADMDDYKHALQTAFQPARRTLHFDHGRRTTIVVAKENWNKGGKPSNAPGILKEDRYIILAEDIVEVPELVLLAADGIVKLEPPEPRHLVAAGKVTLRQKVNVQQARELASMPLSLLSTMLRRGRPVSRSLACMRQVIVRAVSNDPRQIPLEHLHGLGEAGDWARELAIDLEDWREGRINWADLDRGILVSGPSGTGKTTYARALAAFCDVSLVLGSLARWQACGHLGDLLRAMRATFDEARRKSPCILFLDEIDAVGDRATFKGENAQYKVEVVSGLLECLDGIDQREGVIVVGACNYPDRIDPALLRPGRLDRHIRISLPDAAARAGIIRWHLQGALPNDNLTSIAARTEGWSGAALERLVRDARRLARRARRAITVADLMATLPPTITIPPGMMRRTAVHEAGHAIVAVALGRRFQYAEIRDTVESAAGAQVLGGVHSIESPVAEVTREILLDEICFLLAGTAAEDVMLASRSVGGGGIRGSDLHIATLIALRLETAYGLGQGLAFLAEGESDPWRLLHSSQTVRDRVETILAEQMVRARSIVQRHRQATDEVTQELLERRAVGFASVAALLSDVETTDPVFADEMDAEDSVPAV